MTRATGGSACAATSTRSRFLRTRTRAPPSCRLIPICAPSSSTSRTCGARICSLIRACGRPGATGLDAPPWSQRRFTKLLASSFFETTKPLQAAARIPRPSDSVEPPRGLWPAEVRNGPLLLGRAHRVASSCARRLVAGVLRRLLAAALAHRERRRPTPCRRRRSTYGIFSSSASRIRLPTVSSRSSTSTRKPRRASRRARCGGLAVVLADREDPHLHRREPERERAARSARSGSR